MPRISKSMADALSEQANRELASAYTYLAMSAWADEQNLQGASSWLRIQWEEELSHATKLIDYIAERGGRADLKAIPEPQADYQGLHDAFRSVLRHEEEVTGAINQVYELAVAEKDYATQTLLDWYVNEQVEEENQPAKIISMLDLAADSPSGLLMVDRHLAGRARVE